MNRKGSWIYVIPAVFINTAFLSPLTHTNARTHAHTHTSSPLTKRLGMLEKFLETMVRMLGRNSANFQTPIN